MAAPEPQPESKYSLPPRAETLAEPLTVIVEPLDLNPPPIQAPDFAEVATTVPPLMVTVPLSPYPPPIPAP